MKLEQIENRITIRDDGKSAIAEGGMVTAAFPEAVEAGIEMLARGGNAVDAACATALALGVCEPAASGLGGQSFAMLHIRGKTVAVDGSSRAPSLAYRHAFTHDDELGLGHRATTVPTTVAVLGYLSRRYGRLPWADLLQPAIRIAQHGYRITAFQNIVQTLAREDLLRAPTQSGACAFLAQGQQPYKVGDRFVQPELADTLSYLADYGPESFYHGPIAERIDRDMRDNGGFLRADDLALIPWPLERQPLHGYYRGLTVLTTPPPTAGDTLLLTLALLDRTPGECFQREEAASYQLLIEMFHKALLHRSQQPYHPNYRPLIATNIDDIAPLQSIWQSLGDDFDCDLSQSTLEQGDGETTHLSVVDDEGNAVALSQSIYTLFGAKTVASELGFLYNNYMKCFNTEDPRHPYYLRPNAMPFTAVAPAILFHRGHPWLVIGTPGAERIYTAMSQVLVNLLDRSMSLPDAIQHHRLHVDLKGVVHIEGEDFNTLIGDFLRQRGYQLRLREAHAFFFGGMQAIMLPRTNKRLFGAADVRRDGIAKGL